MKRYLPLTISIMLFVLCLVLPAVGFEKICGRNALGEIEVAGLWNEPLGAPESMRGLTLLLLGGFGVLFMQIGALGWLANPLYFLALFTSLLSAKVLARLCALASLGLALVSLHLTNGHPLPADEGGVCYLSAIYPQIGHWLWLSAIGLLNLYTWI